MFRRTWKAATSGLLITAAVASAQVGPDVIVGELPSTAHYGPVGGIHAYAVATTSCNEGDAELDWIQNVARHPVIAQNVYRLDVAQGRFEQIGMSWLKHGFCALQQTSCGSCAPAGGGCFTRLGVGCSDPYGASLNGTQSGLGPRYEVNPATGVYPYPFTSPSYSGQLARRIQIDETDLTTPGALYFIEGHYVAVDDAEFGNQNNNASYRRVTVDTDFTLDIQDSTVRRKSAINAWAAHGGGLNVMDFGVTMINLDVPDDGRFTVAYKVSDNGNGTWHYEYAIHNMNSNRAGGGITFPIGAGAAITNAGFHGVPHHSGEPYATDDWVWDISPTAISFFPRSATPPATPNALRWGTLYNVRFDADTPPVAGNVDLAIFEAQAGSPDNMLFSGLVPDMIGNRPLSLEEDAPAPATFQSGFATTLAVTVNTGDESVVAGSAQLNYRTDSGAFQQTPLTQLDIDTWAGDFPATICGDNPSWYFSVEGDVNGVKTLPAGGATAPYVANVIGTAPPIATLDDVETDLGWSVSGNATFGTWVLADPVGTLAQPESDHTDTGVNCWVTGNATAGAGIGTNDVDGGSTTLVSPSYDLSAVSAATISYWRWYSNDQGGSPNEDTFVVEVTDNGADWEPVETVGPAGPETSGGWFFHEFSVAPTVGLTSNVQVRFTASDLGAGSIVEAAIDDITVTTTDCVDLSSLELRVVSAADQSGGQLDVTAGTIDLYVQARLTLDDNTATGIVTFDGELVDDGSGTFGAAALTIEEATGVMTPGPDTLGRAGMFPSYRGTIGNNNDDPGNGLVADGEYRILPLNVEAAGNGEGLTGQWSDVYKLEWTTADNTPRLVDIDLNANVAAYMSTFGLRQPAPVIGGGVQLVIGTPACPCEVDGVQGVDVLDLLTFLETWFTNNGTSVPPGTAGDYDGNGDVDVLDLLDYLGCWFPTQGGTPCP